MNTIIKKELSKDELSDIFFQTLTDYSTLKQKEAELNQNDIEKLSLFLALMDDAKIIFTASELHKGNILFDDLEFRNKFSSFKSYGHSKLGVIMICRFLANKLNNNNIAIYSHHPGMIRTELGRDAGWLSRFIFWTMGSSPEKGAQTLLYLAETNRTKLKSGEYYAKNQITKTSKESYDMEVASQLLTITKDYLNDYITEPSLFYSDD